MGNMVFGSIWHATSFGLRSLWREARAGELIVLLLALTIAAGTVTAIGFLTDRIGTAVSQQASEVLAADLRLRSTQEIDPALEQQARDLGLRTATVLTFPSVVFKGDDNALAEINAVSELYPLRGELRIADQIDGNPRVTTSVPGSGEAWADAALLARIGATPGDVIEMGSARFTLSAVLNFRPDQTPGFSGLAPTLIINTLDIEKTGLVQNGSRVTHSVLVAGSTQQLTDYRRAIENQITDAVRVQSGGDSGNQLSNAIDRASRFLALASLISLLLAAVAVAMSARRYAQRRLDTAALMKGIGSTQRFVMISTLAQLFVVGLLASLLGALLGFAAERGLTQVLGDLLRDDLPAASLQPVILGTSTVMILLAGFALPSLMRLANTPPARVLRKDLSPAPPSAWLTYGTAIVSLSALVYWSVRDVMLLVVIVGGTLASGLVLYLIGRLLVNVLTQRGGRVGVAWRYGLANIARRGSDSAVQIVAFGLSLMVLLVLTLVRNDLLLGWRATLDQDAPNHFLINIQPQERDEVSAILAADGLESVQFTPLVRARMTQVNGIDIADRRYDSPRGKRLASREANLTYARELPAANQLLNGAWWSLENIPTGEVSLEIDAAQSMHISLGDQLSFDVAGETAVATVTSLREVKWDSFEPNFFMVFSPPTLENAPHTLITSLHIDKSQRGVLLKLVRAFPSVSVIDIEALLDQVRSIIDKAALAVQAIFTFTLLAGVIVLFAAVQSTLDERRYESALLRTFGAKRRTVLAGLATEFVVLGLAAGIFAAIGATIVGGLAATRLFDLPWTISPSLWLVGALTGGLIVGVSGIVATYSAINEPPTRTLR